MLCLSVYEFDIDVCPLFNSAGFATHIAMLLRNWGTPICPFALERNRSYTILVDWKQIAFVAVIVIGVFVYSRLKMGKKGAAGYLTKVMGLRPGENVVKQWTGYFDIDRTVGEKAAAVVGITIRGANVLAGLTDQNRLVIGSNETQMDPISLQKDDLTRVEDVEQNVGELPGPQGMEPAYVIRLHPKTGDPFRLKICRSAAADIHDFAR